MPIPGDLFRFVEWVSRYFLFFEAVSKNNLERNAS